MRLEKLSVLLVIAVGLVATGCGDDADTTESASSSGNGGSGGSGTCASTTGTLRGVIYDRGGPAPQPNGLALVRQMPDDVPLQVMADGAGAYEVSLEAGGWLVTGQFGDYCETLETTEVTVVACGDHAVDLMLDCVLGGGGSGGS